MIKKLLFILLFIILLTEALSICFFRITKIEFFWSWLPALINGTIVSFVSIISTKHFISRPLSHIHGSGKNEWLLLKTGLIVFMTATISMLGISLLKDNPNILEEISYNLFITGISTAGFIYFFILRHFEDVESQVSQHKKNKHIIISTTSTYLGLMTLLAMIVISSYQQQYDIVMQNVQKSETKEIYRIKSTIIEKINTAALDTLILSKQSHVREFLEGNRSMFEEIKNNYSNIIQIKQHFKQIRLLSETGIELLRIENKKGKPWITPPNLLQNKSHRYYFQETIKLHKGDVYISPFDLNIENKQIEKPYSPVIRAATPLANKHNENIGILVINIDGNSITNELDNALSSVTGKLSMLNENGFWLYGSNDKMLWGFMFSDNSEQFSNYYPGAWQSAGRCAG